MTYSDTEVESNETVTSIEDDTTEKVDIHSLTDQSVFDTDRLPFVLSGGASGLSSWSTKMGKSKLESLNECKTGVYIAIKKDLFDTSSTSEDIILEEFKNNYEKLVTQADKVGSGDTLVRGVNDLFAKSEQIGKFISDATRNKDGLKKTDWWVLCFPFYKKSVYETIEIKIQEFNTQKTGKPYAMAEMNQTNGSNGTFRTSLESYISRASLTELEEIMKDVSHEISMRNYERIIK